MTTEVKSTIAKVQSDRDVVSVPYWIGATVIAIVVWGALLAMTPLMYVKVATPILMGASVVAMMIVDWLLVVFSTHSRPRRQANPLSSGMAASITIVILIIASWLIFPMMTTIDGDGHLYQLIISAPGSLFWISLPLVGTVMMLRYMAEAERTTRRIIAWASGLALTIPGLIIIASYSNWLQLYKL